VAKQRSQPDEETAAETQLQDPEAEADMAADEGDAATPSQQEGAGGETAYSQERLIEEATSFLGHPTHVVAGALHGVDQEYLTIKEATKLVDDFLKREV
jgi:hypothetical protein